MQQRAILKDPLCRLTGQQMNGRKRKKKSLRLRTAAGPSFRPAPRSRSIDCRRRPPLHVPPNGNGQIAATASSSLARSTCAGASLPRPGSRRRKAMRSKTMANRRIDSNPHCSMHRHHLSLTSHSWPARNSASGSTTSACRTRCVEMSTTVVGFHSKLDRPQR